MPRHNRIEYPVDLIRHWVAAGDTQQTIADRLSIQLSDPRINAKSIYKVCRKHGITCQRPGPRAGEGHPKWLGGRTRTAHGYVKVVCPDHPTCVEVNRRREAVAKGAYYPKQKYVWEHRLVMEKLLGRFLTAGEVVHHMDGNPSNNAPENLRLFDSNAEHLKFDLAGKIPEWSPEGRARTQAGVEKWRATRRKLRERDALAQLRKTAQSKE